MPKSVRRFYATFMKQQNSTYLTQKQINFKIKVKSWTLSYQIVLQSIQMGLPSFGDLSELSFGETKTKL